MGKIIIYNKSSVTDLAALSMVKDVIKDGRVSDGGKQYCYLTVFTIPPENKQIQVATDLNAKSDKFTLVDSRSV